MQSRPEASEQAKDSFFAKAIVAWQLTHGRHDLPWQNTRDPYRVWLSEIMLQQTQVVTVQAYFARFLVRFPNVNTLAHASLDEVLALWSGLGYYSRARHLHACARAVMDVHGGAFPRSAAQLAALPGIGPSTAAAIASICFDERAAILDGNVKRVLTRYLAFEADLAKAASERALLLEAQRLLPAADMAADMPRYTQGVMDLGATLCTSKSPNCNACPLNSGCAALSRLEQVRFPVKSRRVKRSSKSIWLLWASSAKGAVWLSRRPTPGVWAGLYCFPVFEDEAGLRAALDNTRWVTQSDLPAFKHVLTHMDLYLHAVHVVYAGAEQPSADGAWYDLTQIKKLGLPAPIKKMLQTPGSA
jgi:A/G-specific adenine glycosylase